MTDHPIRVLLVDDQELLRAGFRIILGVQPDIEIIGEASTGAEAIAQTEALAPDVVCMDVQMPGMDGLEATRRIVADPALTAAVLILTTFDRDDYLYDALAAGASGFLLKNSSPEDLIAAVRIVAEGDALLSPAVTRRVIEGFARRGRDANAVGPSSSGGPALGAGRSSAAAARASAGVAVPSSAGSVPAGSAIPGSAPAGAAIAPATGAVDAPTSGVASATGSAVQSTDGSPIAPPSGAPSSGGQSSSGSALASSDSSGSAIASASASASTALAALASLTEREREVLQLVAQGMSNAEVAAALYVGEATVKSHVSKVLQKLSLRDRIQAVIFAYEQDIAAPRA